MKRILFVCLGNICRSPMAEAIFNYQINKKGLEKSFIADSCGTANYHVGMEPDLRTIKIAANKGIPMAHLGRQFQLNDFKNFDLIFPMDASNRRDLLRLPNALQYREKVILMRSFDTLDHGADVPDPYYGNEKEFEEVFNILDRSIHHLIKSLNPDS